MGESVCLIFLSGVATSTDFMDPLREQLMERYTQAGFRVQAHMLQPYGDWNRPMWKQLNEARQDWMIRSGSLRESIRAREVAEKIRSTYDGGSLVLIGHSAGGIAALQGAGRVARDGISLNKIIQIGSPKIAIPHQFQSQVMYLFAKDKDERISDPVVRIGTWGGWQRGRTGIPVWKPRLYAPDQLSSVTLIGGHADYFRTREPYRNLEGKTNLSITSDAIWNYLMT